MSRRFYCAGVIILCFVFGANPCRAAMVEGLVVDRSTGAGLPDVKIVVAASGKSWEVPVRTSNDGVFRIDLSAGLAPPDLETEVVYLNFSKEKYIDHVRMCRDPQRRLVFRGVKAEMVAIEKHAGSGPPASGPTAAGRDSASRRLYLTPYRIYGNDTARAEAAQQINERLPFHLRRGIITHIQALQIPNPPADVALDRLPPGIDGADYESVKEFGMQNDALAVIRGEGALIPGNGHALELTSEFLILPSLPDFRAGSLYVDDRISQADMSPARLSGSLREAWGANTVLAIALQETQDAVREKDAAIRKQRLQRARGYLVAEKRRAGAGSDILVRQIDSLLTVVDREIAK